MLGAGTLLFATSLILMVVLAAMGKPIGKLFLFFALSIVMIGFPAYTKIEISRDGVKLEKGTDQLLDNPTDRTSRDNVSNLVARLSARPLTDPKTLTRVAKAQIALGQNADAEQNVKKALQAAPQNTEALRLVKRLELDRNLEQLSARVEQNPSDQAAKSQLGQVVSDASKIPIASPVTSVNLARAHAALDNQAQAKENLDKALRINPNLTEAVELRNRLNQRVVGPGASRP
jgi:tetratricopeptide (TPR) repeat protein